ncbi:hypothetical protein JL475_18820 [Streptomyces sp. M2CJ-2]|uniref:hypothetical protein n=1 Tax=Streptomyces sp. M2CJ-2 TaxID=2803948 RepID=UPI001927710B|nr:hypothetical protein [Streptomyces sp. M2CJ-2]MBL3668006.1 hypothetical protein [Streptomyces sp. M2CJ-2]
MTSQTVTGATPPAGTPAAAEDARRARYVAHMLALHDRMSLAGLAEQADPLYLTRRPDGLTVLAVPQSRLPERYRLAIYGFRLAQYLRSRFASDRVAFARGLFAEPLGTGHGEEIHVIGMEESAGAILRYVSVIATTDTAPLPVTHPDRAPFPCEVAHGINLFHHVPLDEPVTGHEVWEIKRLMQRPSQRDTSPALRLRLSLELMLGFYTVLSGLSPQPRFLVGDGEEGLAVRRLTRSLQEVTVIEGTRPSLPEDDLLFPAYVERAVVKPFVARVPRGTELDRLVHWLERALDASNPLAGFQQLVGRVGGEIRRVRI